MLAEQPWDAPVRAWLVFLALFEVPAVVNCLWHDKPLTGFSSNLRRAGSAGRRHWAFLLALLVASRLLAAAEPSSRAVRWHLAGVHAVEMLALGSERLRFGSGGSEPVLAVIVANAVGFTAWAALGTEA